MMTIFLAPSETKNKGKKSSFKVSKKWQSC